MYNSMVNQENEWYIMGFIIKCTFGKLIIIQDISREILKMTAELKFDMDIWR